MAFMLTTFYLYRAHAFGPSPGSPLSEAVLGKTFGISGKGKSP
jgi:hypothetical protein